NDDGRLLITFKSDALGRNLGEMVASILSNKRYPNGYFKPNRKCMMGKFLTYWIKRPNLQKVLKYHGCNLYEQTSKINKKIGMGNSDEGFFSIILEYATAKYMLAGLASGSKFSKY